jgi:hypothetical protein
MRKSRLLIAALLTFTIAGAGAAMAFDVQTLGSTNADGTPRFTSPEQELTNSAPNGINLTTPGSNFSTGGGTSVQSFDVPVGGLGWQQMQPIGRLTR